MAAASLFAILVAIVPPLQNDVGIWIVAGLFAPAAICGIIAGALILPALLVAGALFLRDLLAGHIPDSR